MQRAFNYDESKLLSNGVVILWRYDFPLADSLQYGNMGLVMALKKIPLTPDGRFSTYALVDTTNYISIFIYWK